MSWLNTPIHTFKQLYTCLIGLPHFKRSHVSCCRHTHAACGPKKHRSQSTDPEPFKRNVLFSVRAVLSSPVCFVSLVPSRISSGLGVIGHRVAHFMSCALQIVSEFACLCMSVST
ncbi:hypothetical protein ATANTOWER_008978 [Ataeniobius toweri]|uniref:Uncharacterized protein n=1 Tax=Ataeniobius toweri TaxID=208326 RepID=A0ABU7A5T0_9TELE|nr:hypothetical protein [Ataeniobius toweri]